MSGGLRGCQAAIARRTARLNATQRKGSLRGKWLNMDNLARLLTFGPHAGGYARIRALLHVDMARIDGSGQEIGAPFAGFHIEPLNQIGAHIGTPCVFDVVEPNIVRARIRERHIPRRDFPALRVIHRVTIGMEL